MAEAAFEILGVAFDLDDEGTSAVLQAVASRQAGGYNFGYGPRQRYATVVCAPDLGAAPGYRALAVMEQALRAAFEAEHTDPGFVFYMGHVATDQAGYGAMHTPQVVPHG